MFSSHFAAAPALLAQANNWIDAMQTAYAVPADGVHLVLLVNQTMNYLLYGDESWVRLAVKPQLTGSSAASGLQGNVYLDQLNSLRRRGASFLACGNSLRAHANKAVLDQRYPDLATAVESISSTLLAGTDVVPAAVAELSRLQQRGFPMVYVAQP